MQDPIMPGAAAERRDLRAPEANAGTTNCAGTAGPVHATGPLRLRALAAWFNRRVGKVDAPILSPLDCVDAAPAPGLTAPQASAPAACGHPTTGGKAAADARRFVAAKPLPASLSTFGVGAALGALFRLGRR